MPISFSKISERSFRYRCHVLDQLSALVQSGKGLRYKDVAAAMKGGMSAIPNPRAGDPTMLFVLAAGVGLQPSGKALYTVLFAVNARYYELVTQSNAGETYDVIRFAELPLDRFAQALTAFDAQSKAEFGHQDATANNASSLMELPFYDESSSMPQDYARPIAHSPMPSSGAAASMGEYGHTAANVGGGESPYGRTGANVGGGTFAAPPQPSTGALRRVASLKKLFGG